jgi:hypothetical protein
MQVNPGRLLMAAVLACFHWPEVIPKGHADRVRAKLAQLQAQAK